MTPLALKDLQITEAPHFTLEPKLDFQLHWKGTRGLLCSSLAAGFQEETAEWGSAAD